MSQCGGQNTLSTQLQRARRMVDTKRRLRMLMDHQVIVPSMAKAACMMIHTTFRCRTIQLRTAGHQHITLRIGCCQDPVRQELETYPNVRKVKLRPADVEVLNLR